ncbi:LysE family translocator [Burkholderia cenocepacia]|uniref:LysE family translocator n=1 Tax=Burkholderia cenocepacia TaxID=95486 RepID=UPI00222E6689|nr:LysE family translocator [Burkholderia cenocepacia]MCW3500587.1 LysE family translocator [Burkholderia cenocepacia]MCW3508340.1 LysE family translocator [Burkholderia cenocepacia]MCW3515740.1 LysE family translocator [Burkholderia cenocepacia]MCW3530431.1 LysE family translocator [Burkholderia cenocepacia]MCW3546082.1 LysE family translocator [Burkholderia cenocepacia]
MLFIKSVVMGWSIAAPVGPIGMLCIQRSLSRGFQAGFATGIGTACADAIYGLLGALGVAGLVTAFPMLTVALKIGGGAFLVWLAWTIARQAPAAPAGQRELPRTTVLRDFLTTFGLTLSNPMTIVSFVGIFAALGPLPDTQEGAMEATVGSMVAGVFIGSAMWWLCLSGASAALRTKLSFGFMHGLSRVSAAIVAGFGAIQLVAGVRGLI